MHDPTAPVSAKQPLTFRPSSFQQLAALHLARRFEDLTRLPQYLQLFETESLTELLRIARQASDDAALGAERPADLFFLLARGRRP